MEIPSVSKGDHSILAPFCSNTPESSLCTIMWIRILLSKNIYLVIPATERDILRKDSKKYVKNITILYEKLLHVVLCYYVRFSLCTVDAWNYVFRQSNPNYALRPMHKTNLNNRKPLNEINLCLAFDVMEAKSIKVRWI